MKRDKRNLSMLVDFYEFTMMNGYLKKDMADKIAVFDVFFRTVPDHGGFAIYAGLEQVIDYLKNLSFTEEDIEYLKSKSCFSEEFLDYLRNFKFTCDVWSLPEGTPIFPREPILTVKGPIIQAQLVETAVLLMVNHQSLIATKANRIVRAANGRAIMEFGSRRAQNADAAILGARAAYIGGVGATACALTDRDYGVPAVGTMAHSWVQMMGSEYEAFKAYAEVYPENCVLLVDTYDVLNSGVPNAIKVFNEVLKPMGIRPKGIRIDSGDIAYLSQKARKMLDDAGYNDCGIVASNSLDEYLIRDLLLQGASINSFGVGEKLITAKSDAVFGCVYKLVAAEKDGVLSPVIKISENIEKITNPGFKTFYRFYDNETGKAMADYLCFFDENAPDTSNGFEIFDPSNTWKKKTLTNVTAVKMPIQIFKDGKCIYKCPSLKEIKEYCQNQLDTLWSEVKRFDNPHQYYVDLSKNLWQKKNELLNQKTH